MPSMFSEADLDAFHRLRCAFDPAGPGQPRQGDADAAAVRRGPRALPRASARARRRRRAVLMLESGSAAADPATLRGGRPRRCAAAAAEDSAVRIRGGGTKLGWGARPRRARPSSCARPRSTGSSSTTPATSPRSSQAGRAARRASRTSSPREGQMLALDPPLGASGRRRRSAAWSPPRDSGPAAPPLRRAPRPRARRDRRAQRRHDRARRAAR